MRRIKTRKITKNKGTGSRFTANPQHTVKRQKRFGDALIRGF